MCHGYDTLEELEAELVAEEDVEESDDEPEPIEAPA